MRGFQKFLLRGNVVDLAVAVVIGAAFGAVVTALVKDIVTPIIGIAGGYGGAALVRLFLKRWLELPPVHTPLWAIVLGKIIGSRFLTAGS